MPPGRLYDCTVSSSIISPARAGSARTAVDVVVCLCGGRTVFFCRRHKSQRTATYRVSLPLRRPAAARIKSKADEIYTHTRPPHRHTWVSSSGLICICDERAHTHTHARRLNEVPCVHRPTHRRSLFCCYRAASVRARAYA